jgi:hypothetical protein
VHDGWPDRGLFARSVSGLPYPLHGRHKSLMRLLAFGELERDRGRSGDLCRFASGAAFAPRLSAAILMERKPRIVIFSPRPCLVTGPVWALTQL